MLHCHGNAGRDRHLFAIGEIDIDAGPASPYVQFVPIRDYELQVICHAKQHFPFAPRKRGPRGQALNRFKAWVPASAGTKGICGWRNETN